MQGVWQENRSIRSTILLRNIPEFVVETWNCKPLNWFDSCRPRRCGWSNHSSGVAGEKDPESRPCGLEVSSEKINSSLFSPRRVLARQSVSGGTYE